MGVPRRLRAQARGLEAEEGMGLEGQAKKERRLQADPEEELKVVLKPGCAGCPMPGSDMSKCAASDRSMCPDASQDQNAVPAPKPDAPKPDAPKIEENDPNIPDDETNIPDDETDSATRGSIVVCLAVMMLAGVVS